VVTHQLQVERPTFYHCATHSNAIYISNCFALCPTGLKPSINAVGFSVCVPSSVAMLSGLEGGKVAQVAFSPARTINNELARMS